MRPPSTPRLQAGRPPSRLARLLTVLVALVLAGPGRAQQAPPADVLILGTYHFDNPGLDVAQFTVADVLAPDRQAEVAAVVDALAAFRPTRIVVERRPGEAALDSLYGAYRDGRHGLARSEDQQIGFRLAARLGHARVYPVDHEGAFPFEPVMAYAEQHDLGFVATMMGGIRRIEQEVDSLQRTASVGETLRFLNRPEVLARGHALYVSAASVGAGDGYAGADLMSAWFDRNVRIFADLASLAVPGDRVLVIYGSGHAPILRDLVEANPALRLVDPSAYLGR